MCEIMKRMQLQHINLKNRAARSAVHSFLGNADGTISEAEYRMYEQLAQNEIGLIITGHASVSPDGMANEEQAAIYGDAFIAQFARLKERVKPYGAKLVVQINHAGPRAIHSDDLAGVMARELKKGHHCRMLTMEEIAEIEEAFISAAARLQRAGVDGVQVHAAHSYLLSQFLDETFNQRSDAYGGCAKNRFRIVRKIIEGIKARCGDTFPVFVKLNNDTATNDAQYEADLLYMLQEFARMGVEAAELSGYDFLSQPRTARNYYLARAKRLKEATRLPLMLVGGVRSLRDMEEVLEAGIDIVSLGRPLISEPDLLPKLLNGQEKARCVSCNRCFAMPKLQPGVRCVLNRKKKS